MVLIPKAAGESWYVHRHYYNIQASQTFVRGSATLVDSDRYKWPWISLPSSPSERIQGAPILWLRIPYPLWRKIKASSSLSLSQGKPISRHATHLRVLPPQQHHPGNPLWKPTHQWTQVSVLGKMLRILWRGNSVGLGGHIQILVPPLDKDAGVLLAMGKWNEMIYVRFSATFCGMGDRKANGTVITFAPYIHTGVQVSKHLTSCPRSPW